MKKNKKKKKKNKKGKLIPLPLTAQVLKPSLSDEIRNNPILNARFKTPRPGTAPAPEEIPARALLKDIHLRLNIAPRLVYHGRTPLLDRIALALTSSHIAAGAGLGAAVRKDADVGGAAPFADVRWGERVGGAERWGVGADFGDVAGLRKGFVRVGEDLIEVGVNANATAGAELRGEGCPFLRPAKGVVHDDHEIVVRGCGFDDMVAVSSKVFNRIEGEAVLKARLVDKFNADDSVGVL